MKEESSLEGEIIDMGLSIELSTTIGVQSAGIKVEVTNQVGIVVRCLGFFASLCC